MPTTARAASSCGADRAAIIRPPALVHTLGTCGTHRCGSIDEWNSELPVSWWPRRTRAWTTPSTGSATSCRAETRYFGRRGAAAPKPIPSLVRRLESPEPAIGLAALVGGEIIGLARLDETTAAGPELLIAVAHAWRGRGVALALGREVVARAHDAGVPRIVLRTSYRGSDLRELGHALGFEVFDLGRGRLDLVRSLEPVRRSA